MDGPIRRAARIRRSRCVSSRRPWASARAGKGLGHAVHTGGRSDRRSVAAVAGVRRHSSLDEQLCEAEAAVIIEIDGLPSPIGAVILGVGNGYGCVLGGIAA